MNEFKIPIPRQVLSLGEDPVVVFAEVYKEIFAIDMPKIYVTDVGLAYLLFNKDVQRSKDVCMVLAKNKYFKRVCDGCYEVERDTLYSTSFVRISIDEYHSIIKAEKCQTTHKISLLYHFCWVINSFNWKIRINGETGVVSNIPLSYFVEREDKSTKSIKRYNKELEEMGLISVIHGGYNPAKDSRTPNYYCRPEYKNEVERFAGGEPESDLSDVRRSVTAKFNHYVKNPDKYTQEVAWNVLNGCIKYWDLNKDKDKQDSLMIFVNNGVIEAERLDNAIKKNIKRNTK